MGEPAEIEIFADHSVAVVDDANFLGSPAGEANLNVPRTGVERVVQKLADNRLGPVDHLSRGDLACNLVAEEVDTCGGLLTFVGHQGSRLLEPYARFNADRGHELRIAV